MAHYNGFDCIFCDGHCRHIEDVQQGSEVKSIYTCDNDKCNVGLIYIYWEVDHEDADKSANVNHRDLDLDNSYHQLSRLIETDDQDGLDAFESAGLTLHLPLSHMGRE